nr:immunoglobulin heavy chain junction region [Mus musculus]MBK4185388.1 immunoglobulin heavy chain junction region [Mus musculus]MBK4189197.1 immunoglobulin heavy chain junction region [Mus musculus]MBK4189198.1 immunoglobulin heavy chain junction region [Mus musculus]MBK4189199.1 immunoglobulin heavy chain junction region [Mus musculus]
CARALYYGSSYGYFDFW